MQKLSTLALASQKLLLFYGNRQGLRLSFTMTLSVHKPALSGHYNEDVNAPLFGYNKYCILRRKVALYTINVDISRKGMPKLLNRVI